MIAPRRLHRVAGAVLAVFLTVHVANRLAALAGVEAHLRFMGRGMTPPRWLRRRVRL